MHMAFSTQYNCASLKNENVLVTRVLPANYEFGIVPIVTPEGNEIKAYNVDIVNRFGYNSFK